LFDSKNTIFSFRNSQECKQLKDFALNKANFKFVYEISISSVQMCKLRFRISEKLTQFGMNLIESMNLFEIILGILAFGMY
jgi:hypothetical protein